MPNVCILVRVQPGQVKKIMADIKKLQDIEEVSAVFGRYDVVVFARPATYEKAREFSREINALPGVKSSETLMES